MVELVGPGTTTVVTKGLTLYVERTVLGPGVPEITIVLVVICGSKVVLFKTTVEGHRVVNVTGMLVIDCPTCDIVVMVELPVDGERTETTVGTVVRPGTMVTNRTTEVKGTVVGAVVVVLLAVV